MTQPSLFLSHGAPDIVLHDTPARHFLAQLGQQLRRPEAILIASAHDEADGAVVRAPERWRTWHDFGRFDARLFDMRYEPPVAREAADAAVELLAAAGLWARRGEDARLDHGAWTPLSLVYPGADVPIATVGIDPRRNAGWHEALGRALAPLRERNILIIGSGSISHNLSEVFGGRGGDRAWVEGFTDWMAARVEADDRQALLNAAEAAPAFARNHPTDEHFLPFYTALGAGGPGRRIHQSYTYDVLAMDAYAFG
jgi:4,5-DOPA dioxygenase extradiol